MRRVVLLALSCALLGAAGGKPLPQAKPPIPVEDRTLIDPDLSELAIQSFASLVRYSGWRCDSVHSLIPMMFRHGFTLTCNGGRFTYDFTEPGGKIHIEAR